MLITYQGIGNPELPSDLSPAQLKGLFKILSDLLQEVETVKCRHQQPEWIINYYPKIDYSHCVFNMNTVANPTTIGQIESVLLSKLGITETSTKMLLKVDGNIVGGYQIAVDIPKIKNNSQLYQALLNYGLTSQLTKMPQEITNLLGYLNALLSMIKYKIYSRDPAPLLQIKQFLGYCDEKIRRVIITKNQSEFELVQQALYKAYVLYMEHKKKIEESIEETVSYKKTALLEEDIALRGEIINLIETINQHYLEKHAETKGRNKITAIYTAVTAPQATLAEIKEQLDATLDLFKPDNQGNCECSDACMDRQITLELSFCKHPMEKILSNATEKTLAEAFEKFTGQLEACHTEFCVPFTQEQPQKEPQVSVEQQFATLRMRR